MDKLKEEFMENFEDKYKSLHYSSEAVWKWITEKLEPKQASSSDIKEVIEHLNKVTGKKYKPNGAATKRFINARLKDFTVEDLKLVVDIKSASWLGTDQAIYLRPETLFGTKMESYLNESYTPRANPMEALEKELSELFLSGNISMEDQQEMRNGGWPSKPWASDHKAHELAKKIHNLKKT